MASRQRTGLKDGWKTGISIRLTHCEHSVYPDPARVREHYKKTKLHPGLKLTAEQVEKEAQRVAQAGWDEKLRRSHDAWVAKYGGTSDPKARAEPLQRINIRKK